MCPVPGGMGRTSSVEKGSRKREQAPVRTVAPMPASLHQSEGKIYIILEAVKHLYSGVIPLYQPGR